MKKKTLTLVLASVLAISFAYAENIKNDVIPPNDHISFMQEEEYIDDIPFNTADIISLDVDINKDSNISEPGFEIYTFTFG